jgi:hypothetical protein
VNAAQRRLVVFALVASAVLAFFFGFALRQEVPLFPDAANNPNELLRNTAWMTKTVWTPVAAFVSFVLPVFFAFAAVFVRLGGPKATQPPSKLPPDAENGDTRP